MRIELASENAFIVYLGEGLNTEVAAQVQAANASIRAGLGDLLIDTIASYASVLVIFDVLRCDHDHALNILHKALVQLPSRPIENTRLVELPVYYSEESGPDLLAMSTALALPVADIIALHQAQEYRVYAIGFAPGFAYLGKVDERIACPRLTTPRQYVPKGAVAIADQQTAVYPAASPGGWNIIGLCPTAMFTPSASTLMPVVVGDRVRFNAISREQFLALGGHDAFFGKKSWRVSAAARSGALRLSRCRYDVRGADG